MSARSMLPRYRSRHAARRYAARQQAPAAPSPARGPVFRLDYAAWHAHLAGRSYLTDLAPAPPRIVPLADAPRRARPDGIEAVDAAA